ncbi:MAG TPA: cytochrome c oxidase subunit 3 [Ilumatobacteraceae bacterium]|nr:cytochrome c oxidase subunit 3 [Ilumatobacteraceae bacterium]
MSDLVTSEEEQPPVVGLPPSSRSTAQFGVIVFLASDVMLFAPFFAAYFLLRADNQPWPPDGVDLDVPRAFAATLVLVLSSFTLIASDRAGERPGGARAMRNWLLVTIVLGAVFVTNQLLEYRALDFAADTPYGSIYYLVTGLHGLHVTVGIAAMALLFVRAVRAADRHDVATWAGGVSLFWHLVDVIWVFVFSMIWLLQ